MSRIVFVTFWIALVVSVIALAHYYVWARLVRDTQLPPMLRAIMTAMLIGFAVALPSIIIGGRLLSLWGQRGIFTVATAIAFAWFGFMFYMLVILAAFDLVQLAIMSLDQTWGDTIDESKRLFMARAAGGLAAASSFGVSVLAVRQVMVGPMLETLQVKLPRLPAKLNGFRIAQISDLHIGATIGRAYVQQVVEEVNALKPDLIAITGDLVDGSVRELWPIVELLKDMQATHGVYFVTGNHEYYSGAKAWIEALPRLGWRVLVNERVTIGSGDDSFELIGVNDYTAKHYDDVVDFERAMHGYDPKRESILLAHQPKAVYQAAKYRIGLQLSGHTHAGQMWPFTYAVKLVQPYVQGLSQHNDTTQIYVNRGTGYWGPPMRLPDRSEITLLELTS